LNYGLKEREKKNVKMILPKKGWGKRFPGYHVLIRSIQCAEKHPDCFRKGDMGKCDQFAYIYTVCKKRSMNKHKLSEGK